MEYWWIIVPATVGALVSILLTGYGFGQGWGSAQWGPVSAWFSGVLTFGAVSIALWQAFRARIEREIDLELDRRRECIRAVSDVWAAVQAMRAASFESLLFLVSPSTYQEPDPKIRREIVYDRRRSFDLSFQQGYFAPRFYANIILHETALSKPLDDLHGVLAKILQRSGGLFQSAAEGKFIDKTELDGLWHQINLMRNVHRDLTRASFSLDRHAVRADLRHRRT